MWNGSFRGGLSLGSGAGWEKPFRRNVPGEVVFGELMTGGVVLGEMVFGEIVFGEIAFGEVV